MARRRNLLYLRSEKLCALLSPGTAQKILFSGKADWEDDIQSGFRRLHHQVDFGPIAEDSFQRYDIVVPLSFPALEEAIRRAPPRKSALPLPSAASVRLCDDKYVFNQALIEAGFGSCIPRVAQGLGLTPPYILKKRIGWFGSGFKGQTDNLFKVIHRCPYLDLFAEILRTIQFEGLCCVNYKVAQGQPYLLEINPRFGGSLAPYFFSFIRHLR